MGFILRTSKEKCFLLEEFMCQKGIVNSSFVLLKEQVITRKKSTRNQERCLQSQFDSPELETDAPSKGQTF